MQTNGECIKFIIITESIEFQKQIKDILLQNHYTSVNKKRFSLKETLKDPEMFLYNIKPDFLIVSFTNIDVLSINLTRKLKYAFSASYIIVIAEENSLKQIQSLCLAGIDGFLIKQEINNLNMAIHTILSGKRYLDQILLNCLFQNMLIKGSDTYDDHQVIFNLKEHQVFQLIDAGYSEDIIAEILDIDIKEVMLYKNRLLKKIPKKQVCEKI